MNTLTKFALMTESGSHLDLFDTELQARHALREDASGMSVAIERWIYTERADGTHEILRKYPVINLQLLADDESTSNAELREIIMKRMSARRETVAEDLDYNKIAIWY